MKKYYIVAISLLFVLSNFSCKKFVEEELISTLTFDYYKTDKALVKTRVIFPVKKIDSII